MTVARSRAVAEDAADNPLARLARLRTQTLAAALPETALRPRPKAAPSPLGGVRRALAAEAPAWGDSAPAVAQIEPLRLAVLGTLAVMLLIIGFGVTQRLAQNRTAPHVSAARSAEPVAASAASKVATTVAVAQPAVATPALMPPPAAATPSAQLSAIKQALDGAGAAAGTASAATTAADTAAPLSGTNAPPVAAPPPAAVQAASGWGAPPGQQTAAVGHDAWTTAPDGFLDQQGATAGPVVGSAPSPGSAIVWPVVGPLTSCFCPYHPLGIDVGVPLNTPVRAMAAGKVAFAGGNACCSYGYYVDIDHGNGIMTRYGHLSYIPAIPVGTIVRPGDIIGMSGTTGYSTGPHLHFEVRLNGVPVNPMDVLP
jgi:murein DD-endopeptidase MepM/ murein hydrolase activator NlpD